MILICNVIYFSQLHFGRSPGEPGEACGPEEGPRLPQRTRTEPAETRAGSRWSAALGAESVAGPPRTVRGAAPAFPDPVSARGPAHPRVAERTPTPSYPWR